MWNPAQYLTFGDERARPFHDLVGRIGAEAPETVVDLGCGPGGLTAGLPERWPGARVLGVDSSAEMIAEAAPRAAARPDGRLRFEQADLRAWQPGAPVDVLIANAALQWVPEHVDLLERFAGWLGPGGWLAFQVPGNFRAPSHALLAELRQSSRWRDAVGEGADRHLSVLDPAGYAERLIGLGLHVDAWETTYLHLLGGPDPVLEWVKGTGLRPVLARLDGADQEEFLDAYAARLREAYPAWPDGITPLPFRRIFVVARRAA
jgi:trans-aconitate 2-methyltransferase